MPYKRNEFYISLYFNTASKIAWWTVDQGYGVMGKHLPTVLEAPGLIPTQQMTATKS